MQSLAQIAMKKLYIDLTLITDLPPYRQKQIIKDYLLSENNKKTYSWIIKELNRIKIQYPNLDCVSNEILDDLKKIPKYYAYHQKGWGQIYDRNISNYTVIEAYSAIEANEKAEKLGINTDPNQNPYNLTFPIYNISNPNSSSYYSVYYSFWNIVSEEDGHFNEIENVEDIKTDSYFVHYIDGSMFRSRKAIPYMRDMYVIYDDVNYDFMDLPNITIFNEIE
jgi:hypothetical protein